MVESIRNIQRHYKHLTIATGCMRAHLLRFPSVSEEITSFCVIIFLLALFQGLHSLQYNILEQHLFNV